MRINWPHRRPSGQDWLDIAMVFWLAVAEIALWLPPRDTWHCRVWPVTCGLLWWIARTERQRVNRLRQAIRNFPTRWLAEHPPGGDPP